MKQHKKCKKCKEVKDFKDFNKHKEHKDGLKGTCSACNILYNKEWRLNNPEKKKAYDTQWYIDNEDYNKNYYERNKELWRTRDLMKKFGLTQEKYQEMFDNQKGVCNICHMSETAKDKKFLSVDHDHKTGKIRGLLCGNCNKSLGGFKDNTVYLHNAIKYLEGASK